MANRKLSKDEMIITSKHPEWLDTLVADRHCNDKLYKIILFFVIFSPCSKYCTQGRTLQFYNWKEKPWSTNRYLKSRLDDGVFTDRRNYFRCAEKISSLIEDFRKTDLGDNFYLHRAVERVAFTKVESSEYMSLFYHIRCALAHGRIAMFEDAATKDKPIYDEWYRIKFKGKKDKFKEEHESELRKYYAAERKLKPHFHDGKLPLTKWRKDAAALEVEYASVQTEMEVLRDDVRNLRQVTLAVRSANIEKQQLSEQNKNRHHQNER